jgi:uncharacterized protein involved in exopolysaccharide biosynthesis
MKRIFAAVVLVIIASFVTYAQQTPCESVRDVKTTPAYSMLILRKVAVEAALQKVLSEYTSDHPSAKARQLELDVLNREMEKMAETEPLNLVKLTSGYGTLILQKVKLASEMQILRREYTSDYPDVKLKEVELNLLEHEIAKIMN